MRIEEFLGRLKGVVEKGEGRWSACCPAHDDSNPSMSVTVGDKGGILVHCHAGCSAEEIVRAMGLKMADLMPPGKTREGRKGGAAKKRSAAAKDNAAADSATDAGPLPSFLARKKRPFKNVCNYDYQDATGAVIYRVVRRVYTDARGGKTFVQSREEAERRLARYLAFADFRLQREDEE